MIMKFSTILLLAIFLPAIISANAQGDDETTVRKYVSRTYQLTDGALAQCPSDYIDRFEATLNQFKKTYPELLRLVKSSRYYPQAVIDYADDIERSKTKPQERLSRECQYAEHLLKSMLDTDSGKKSVATVINALQTE